MVGNLELVWMLKVSLSLANGPILPDMIATVLVVGIVVSFLSTCVATIAVPFRLLKSPELAGSDVKVTVIATG